MVKIRGTGNNAAAKAANVLVEGVLPFKRTPANILARAVEYSPVGLAKGLTYDLAKVKSGEMEAWQAIDDISAGLTGTAIVGLGMLLASRELVTGGESDDDDEKALDNLEGKQNYALNIGNKSYTIDWLAPAAAPLFAGAFLYESLTADGYSPDDVFKVASALASILNPLLELSMLDGISSALKSYESGAQQAVDIGISALTSYLGQYIPTLVGQIARSVDSIQRSTYATGDSTIEKALKRFVLQSAAKIPGLSKLLEPALDAHGNAIERPGGNFFGRLLLNTISPGYLSISSAEGL